MCSKLPIFHVRTLLPRAGRASVPPRLELQPSATCLPLIAAPCPQPPASEEGSESEGSESSGRSCRNERSVQEKLQVLAAEGLLPAVKVFLDWLRANPDLIVVCAQVRLLAASGAQPRGAWGGPSGSSTTEVMAGTCFGWALNFLPGKD